MRSKRTRAELNGLTTPGLLSTVLVAIVLLSQWSAGSVQQDITTMLVYTVAVVGLYVFVGNTGITSFGHVSFMAIGAYVGSILALPEISKQLLLPDIPDAIKSAELAPMVAVLAGGLVAGAFSALLAGPLMRMAGIGAAISLLAVLIIVNVVLSETDSWTRGSRSLSAIPLATTTGNALLFAIAAVFVAYAYQRSRWGLRARASREDEFAAQAAGIIVPWERTVALVLSAVIMGCGGALYAFLLGAINPGIFYLDLTTVTLVMLIVGGVRSLTGAVAGTVVVFALSEALRRVEAGIDLGVVSIPERPGLELVGLALAALMILIWRPSGLTGGRELTVNSIARATAALGARLADHGERRRGNS